MIFFQAFALLFAPFLALQQGQYRGPEYETLLATGIIDGAADNGAGDQKDLLDPMAAEGFGRWEFWFEINKDILLRTERPHRIEVLNKEEEFPFGVGRINHEIVEKQIYSLLVSGLEKDDPALHRSYLYGLGKLSLGQAAPYIFSKKNENSQESKQFALLCAGLIDDRQSLAQLVGEVQAENSPMETRAYAALALGLRGSPETVSIIRKFVAEQLNLSSSTGPKRNVMAAALVALGMHKDEQAVPMLVEKYRELEKNGASVSRILRTVILTTLGRLGDSAALTEILKALKSKDIEIRRAAALACGDMANEWAVADLAKALQEDPDEQTRGFAAISLGRIGTQEAREALRAGFASKKSRTVSAYCAIALGLAKDQESVAALRSLLNSNREDSLRSSAALGLGFMHDNASAPLLLELVEKKSLNDTLRGYIAIGVGLIRPDEGLARLLKLLQQHERLSEEFNRGLVLGVGLFKDPAATKDLIKVLAADARDIVRGHAALALGMTRDTQAVELLKSIVESKTRENIKAQLYAGIALGELGRPYNYPRLSEAFFNTNYRVRIEILDQIKSIF